MYIGNFMLLIFNLPLVGLFINLLRVPYHLLFPGILLICFVGVYSVNLSATDLWIMASPAWSATCSESRASTPRRSSWPWCWAR